MIMINVCVPLSFENASLSTPLRCLDVCLLTASLPCSASSILPVLQHTEIGGSCGIAHLKAQLMQDLLNLF